MDDRTPPQPYGLPTANRPLLGLTILIVEDSRFASEAMRLLCLRSGARLRRADCLASARRHLQVYRPSAVIVDFGLPDGSGLDLIAELNEAQPRVAVILGMSGDDRAPHLAAEAGADGCLVKPLDSLMQFQQAIIAHLPQERQIVGPRHVDEDPIRPDPAAYHEDMTHAADLLEDDKDGQVLDYVAQFLGGVAASARDTQLADAADALAHTRKHGAPGDELAVLAHLNAMVRDRLQGRAAI